MALIVLAAVVIAGGGVTAFLLLRSSGNKVEVPAIAGLSMEEAEALIEGAGLELEAEEVSLSAYGDGEIVTQDPEAG